MASQYEQDRVRRDRQRGRDDDFAVDAPRQRHRGAEFGADERFGGPVGAAWDEPDQRGLRDQDFRRDQGQLGGGRPGYESQGYREPYAEPYAERNGFAESDQGRDMQGSQGHRQDLERGHTGVFAYQRHGASGQGYGRPEQRFSDQRSTGRDYVPPSSVQGSGRYQPRPGYAGQGLHPPGYGGHRQGAVQLEDDGPIDAGQFDDFERGDRARSYSGDGGFQGHSPSAGVSTRHYGGSGYAEQTGAAGGGHSAGYRGLGPRGYTRSDARLCEDINERLTDDDRIDASGITVDVSDGVVTLSGEVEERRVKHCIEDLVEQCHGVQDIRNQIAVKRGSGRVGEGSGDRAR